MPRFRLAVLLFAAVPCILSAGAIRDSRGRPQAPGVASGPLLDGGIHRLTTYSGLETDIAWSPDGRSIAYASDRSGNFDVWVQPAERAGEGRHITSEATQITQDPASDWQPHWASDGKRLVFRSERDGGGLFVVSAQGGDVQRLTSFGYQPQWSPDGRRILFSASHLLVMGQRQRFYVVNVAGGEPQEVLSTAGERFTSAPQVCWHPDGRRISLAGLDEKGRVLVRTIAIDAQNASDSQLELNRLGETNTYSVNGAMWSRGADALFLLNTDPSGTHVWRVPVSVETSKQSGSPQRVATRAHLDSPIALSPDGTRLAFTMSRQVTRIWTHPLESTRGRIAGSSRAITPENATAIAPDFTPDGKKLIYILVPDPAHERTSRSELHEWTPAGDRTLVADDATRFAPRVSRDGRYVASRLTPREGDVSVVAVLDTVTSKERRITSPSLFATPFGWTHDNASILTSVRQATPPRHGLFRVPVRDGEAPSQLLSVAVHPKYDIWQGTQSPDGRWIAFVVQEPTPRWSAIFLVPTAGGPWMQVTDGRGWDDKPRWSPDGRLLYFLTSRGGPYTLAAVGIDQGTGKPAGPSIEVLSWPAPRVAVFNGVGWNELALAADAVAVPLVETTGSVWMTGADVAQRDAGPITTCAGLVPPAIVARATPRYTPDARRRKAAGTVNIEAVVASDGTVRSLRVVQSPDPRLNAEAMRAASQWTFRPAHCKGENTTATVLIEVTGNDS